MTKKNETLYIGNYKITQNDINKLQIIGYTLLGSGLGFIAHKIIKNNKKK